MSRDFERVYAASGRASFPPERLVRALTLQVLYPIRSERLLCEQLDYYLLFRWFVGLSVDLPVCDHSSFTKNPERPIEAKVARKLLRRVVRKAQAARLLSNEHFSVDGTLIESWAAVKSMRRRDGRDEPPGAGRSPLIDFHGERRPNETHVSPIDPEAQLYRKGKGQPAKLYFMGNVLMEHRHGLPVDVDVTPANGFAEPEAALAMLDRLPQRSRRTLAGDKAYGTADFVADCRDRGRGAKRPKRFQSGVHEVLHIVDRWEAEHGVAIRGVGQGQQIASFRSAVEEADVKYPLAVVAGGFRRPPTHADVASRATRESPARSIRRESATHPTPLRRPRCGWSRRRSRA